MTALPFSNGQIRVEAHSSARDQAVAETDITPGTTILSTQALSFVLLPKEKGLRCDACCRCPADTNTDLKRCSGCASYWYCGIDCQTRHWNAIHKFMCKSLDRFQANEAFQKLQPHRQLDSLLLSHLVTEHLRSGQIPNDLADTDPLKIFMSLLPQTSVEDSPPIVPISRLQRLPADVLQRVYDRFGNNNFIVHSHLTSIAHAIFPIASRLFNHSCVPNAVAVYEFSARGIQMSMRPLRRIEAGEEITIPYFDPALPYKTRQQICQITYDFSCTCSNCLWYKSRGKIEKPPQDAANLTSLETSLLTFAFPKMPPILPPKQLLFTLPELCTPLLHDEYLPKLAATFVDASHDGPLSAASYSGKILLGFYVVAYPPGYPLIGTHCLELAKVTWNRLVEEGGEGSPSSNILTVAEVRTYIAMAKAVLEPLGVEGDGMGPLQEIAALERLLSG